MYRYLNNFLAIVITLIAFSFCFSILVRASDYANDVDLELLLLADISKSMDKREREMQRNAYIAAISDPRFLNAIQYGTSSAMQSISLAYVEWAGSGYQKVIVPWTKVETQQDIDTVITLLTTVPLESAQKTSVSSALKFAYFYFDENIFNSFNNRRVIDISSDGKNNDQLPPNHIRDILVADGFVINVLPLFLNNESVYVRKNISNYYFDCVRGGAGSFIEIVHNLDDFKSSLLRKLVKEIAFMQNAPATVKISNFAFKDEILNEVYKVDRPKANCSLEY